MKDMAKCQTGGKKITIGEEKMMGTSGWMGIIV
jgi:hypothetical protein